MPETLCGPARDLSAFSDKELLEVYKTATHSSDPDVTDIALAFCERYPDTPIFEVKIANNGPDQKDPVRLLGPSGLLADQSIIHPLVMNMIIAYVKNQHKEDLYFFIPEIHLGFELYTISC